MGGGEKVGSVRCKGGGAEGNVDDVEGRQRWPLVASPHDLGQGPFCPLPPHLRPVAEWRQPLPVTLSNPWPPVCVVHRAPSRVPPGGQYLPGYNVGTKRILWE